MTRSITTRTAAALHLFAWMLLLPVVSAHAQQMPYDSDVNPEKWRVGIYGGMQWVTYTADMAGLPGVPTCCPRYTGGSGDAITFGVSAESPIVPGISGGFRLLFVGYNGVLDTKEYELITADPDTTTAIFGHTIDLWQPALATEAMIAYEPLPRLRLLAGARVDVMLGGTYQQQERIIAPGNVRFENGLRVRMVYDGDIPRESPTHGAITAGIRYDFPLNAGHTLMLSPEVQVWQGLGNLVATRDLTMRGVHIGLNLYYVSRSDVVGSSPLDPVNNPVPENIGEED